MSNKAITTRPQDWAMIKEVSPDAAETRWFGVTEIQARLVMLKGHELGMGLTAAFEFIHVIDGKPSISPKGTLALIHRSGELRKLMIDDVVDDEGNPVRCNVHMERINGFQYGVTYSMDDARRANLVKPGSAWEKYPANMLRWRAVGYCADVVFPDVIGGMLRPEELGAEVDEGGEPLWSEVTTTVPPLATEGVVPMLKLDQADTGKEFIPVDPSVSIPVPDTTGWDSAVSEAFVPISDEKEYPTTIDALLAAGRTAEQIVVANKGIIPATAEDCQRVAKILEAQDAQG